MGMRGRYKGCMWLCLIMLPLGGGFHRGREVRVPTDRLRGHNASMDGCKGRPYHAIIRPLLTRASYAFDIISLLKS